MNRHASKTPSSTVLMRAVRMSVVLIAVVVITGTVLIFA